MRAFLIGGIMSEDRLLKIEEAAARLGTSKDWLYRNHQKLPFTVYLSERQIRFSNQGIDEWIQRHKNSSIEHSDKEEAYAGKRVQAR
jgi:predicted DNA-binding transcriptional regulator AlpA